MSFRVLVFGQTGQVATELRRLEGRDVNILTLSRAQADLRDPAGCASAVMAADVDAVINAAAWTAVDRAETEEAEASAANALAPGAMAHAAAQRGLPFVHISSDYVFDGSGDTPWREDDTPAPLSAYGRSKLAGEEAVRAANGRFAILRTSWVFAGHGQNFVRSMLRLGATRDRLTVVDDQRGGPTPAASIASALVTMATELVRGRGECGVFHFSGAPAVTWCGFAREIFAQSGSTKPPVVEPIGTDDWPTPAQRPRNSMLDCSKILRAYGIVQPDWRAELAAVLAELKRNTE